MCFLGNTMEAVHVSPRGKEALQLITTLLPTPFTQRFRLLFSPLVQTHNSRAGHGPAVARPVAVGHERQRKRGEAKPTNA